MGACESSKKYEKTNIPNGTPRNNSNVRAQSLDNQPDSNVLQNQNTKKIVDVDQVKISPETLGENVDVDPLKHYTILNEFGTTELGKHYMVKHNDSKLTRFMSEYTIKDKSLFENIRQKNDILRKMDHPRILKVYEVYYFKDKYYIISEYFEKGDLAKIIEEKKTFNEKQVANIIYKILLAVQYAHENNIIHGHLSPLHIIINEISSDGSYDVKVRDFSYLLSDQTIKFKKNYEKSELFAPEILLDKPIDKAVDMWTIGVLTYFLLDGNLPFEGKKSEDIHSNIVKFESVKFMGEKIKKTTSMAKEFIKKLIIFDPNKRLTAFDALKDKWFNNFRLTEKNTVIESSKLEHFMSNMNSYGDHFKIQQICIALIVHNLPQNCEIKLLEKAFTSMDVDLNGRLTKNELLKGFNNIFKNRQHINTEQEVERIFQTIDVDNSGTIGYAEFISACIDRKTLLEDQYLKFAFSCFDDNNSGYITCQELKNVLTGGGRNEVTKEVVLEIMSSVDDNDDKKINYDEFKKMMKKLME